MKKWRYIVIHHSKTEDGMVLDNFEAIRTYHTSYRYKDKIISEEEARKLMVERKWVEKPWLDIGYHKVCEYDNNKLVVKDGRDLDTQGAHVQGLNHKCIGVCLIGDFDKKEPVDEQYDLLADIVIELMKKCNVEPDKIVPHSYFAPWKSCPGHKFNWTKFIIKITRKWKDGIPIEPAIKPPVAGEKSN